MSKINLKALKKSQVATLPAMLAAYGMGQRDEFLGINSSLLFVFMLVIVVVNFFRECQATVTNE
jgi:hypothetical protein